MAPEGPRFVTFKIPIWQLGRGCLSPLIIHDQDRAALEKFWPELLLVFTKKNGAMRSKLECLSAPPQESCRVAKKGRFLGKLHFRLCSLYQNLAIVLD